MPKLIEWRTRGTVDDALLVIDAETGAPIEGYVVDEALLLADYLNEMTGLERRGAKHIDVVGLDPEQWGELVLARSENGEVLRIDPELYWAGVAVWFRARGDDPHPWRGRD